MAEIPPFRLERASRDETPVVVEVPHAGVYVDPVSLATMAGSMRAVGRDADLLVDDLFVDAPEFGATLLSATHSRLVVDLNRGPSEYDGVAVEGGQGAQVPRGVIWRTSTEGEPLLFERLSKAELARRLQTIYEPYHAALREELDRKRERFGYVILLCAHSMPSTGRRGHIDVGTGRADVVPGTRGRTTAANALIDAVDATATRLGFSVKHDDPYRGGFSTGHYGRPSEHVHAIQVELARRIYMDEDRLFPLKGMEPWPNGSVPATWPFDRTRELARAMVEALAKGTSAWGPL